MSSSTEKTLSPGKLPHRQLQAMLESLRSKRDKSVVIGPAMGIDAAVVNLPSGMIAITCDPITLAGDLAAYYCVNVNANDIAVMGAEPEYMIVSALFPPTPAKEIKKTARQLAKYANELDIKIIGGHTEITEAVNMPVLIATMFGRLRKRGRIISATAAKPGEVVIMTKYAAIETTSIIAREKTQTLKQAGFSVNEIRKAKNLLFKPGISIIPEAKIAFDIKCSAMHDVTEGGIISALWELAQASNTKIEVSLDDIPILPITKRMCKLWDIDPLRTISSGSLLVTISAERAERFIRKLAEAKISACCIGRVLSGKVGLFESKKRKKLLPCQDEIVKIYKRNVEL